MARRIAILCEHGIIEHDEYGRELTGCEGGRVLDPGELIDLIDNHTQAIIDGLKVRNLTVAPGASIALDLGILDLDALAGGEG